MSIAQRAQSPNPAAPAKVRRIEREAMALTLRKQGGSYRKIAQVLSQRPDIKPSYSERDAYGDVMNALDRLNQQAAEAVETVRRLEVERLDELLSVFWPKALKGDYAAVDRILSMMERRARLLGLNQDKVAQTIDLTLWVREKAAEWGLDPDEAVKEAENIIRTTGGVGSLGTGGVPRTP